MGNRSSNHRGDWGRNHLGNFITDCGHLISTFINICSLRDSLGLRGTQLFLDTLLGACALLLNLIPADILCGTLLLIDTFLDLLTLPLGHIVALLLWDLSGDGVTHLLGGGGAALLRHLPHVSGASLLLFRAAGLLRDCLGVGDDLCVAHLLRDIAAHLGGLRVVLGDTLGSHGNSHSLLLVSIAIARLSL